MKRCYDGTLAMPSGCAVMDEEEMMYLEGGTDTAPIPVTVQMLSKDYCTNMAKQYTEVTGMSEERIAQEIYAHAVLTFVGINGKAMSQILTLPFGDSISDYLVSRGKEINLGGDAWYRVAAYKIIWEKC